MPLNLSCRAVLAAPAPSLAGPALGQGRIYRNPILPSFYSVPSTARQSGDYFLQFVFQMFSWRAALT